MNDQPLSRSEAPPGKRVAVVFGVGGLAILAIVVGMRSFQLLSYARHQRETAALISSMELRRPPDVDGPVWDVATGWAVTAFHNVCFDEQHVPLSELVRFRSDVEEQLDGEVDLETVDWIWRRLAVASPHGHDYVEKFEPLYRSDVFGETVD